MPLYTFLSPYDTMGYPSNINVDDKAQNIYSSISQTLLDDIYVTFPAGRTLVDIHPDWIKKSDIRTIDTCEITLTFIHEGAGYKNGLSYYIYDLDSPPTRFQDIDNIYIVFPNASMTGSGGSMNTGDTMKIPYNVTSVTVQNDIRFGQTFDYVFPENKGIAFVLHANRWRSGKLLVDHIMYSSDPVLNPESSETLQNHFINYISPVDPTMIIYGVEDIRRSRSNCDHDFNDLVFSINPSPISSIDASSYNSTTKQIFKGTILCEDLLNTPNGDGDYDDICFEYVATETIENDKITSLTFRLKGLCRGATLDHEFGVVIPNIKNISDVKIINETYISSLDKTTNKHFTSTVVGKGTDRVPIVVDTKEFLPHPSTWAANTIDDETDVIPSFAVTRIIFPGGIERSNINNLLFPYNFYLMCLEMIVLC